MLRWWPWKVDGIEGGFRLGNRTKSRATAALRSKRTRRISRTLRQRLSNDHTTDEPRHAAIMCEYFLMLLTDDNTDYR
jgi:hypothetical protein